MKPVFFSFLGVIFAFTVEAADTLQSKSTYAKSYGTTQNPVAIDPAKDLPRYPAVEPKDAVATWQVKKGFHLELAANEPQLRSPVAISYDENGRMFVCEMIDYSEMRDVTPHLGRVSVLEDKDGDGHFETSAVYADDLPWPTGLICANGGVFVIATPDIWFFKDTSGDGKADVREKVFTGFGTGLKLLNVQGLANSPMWGQDNRIHVLAGGGNRGVITCLKRPELKGVELGGKDFWFDPRTFEFGLEAGGAQYGMSFDNYGRKFGCSNSDHLQYWVTDDNHSGRNPFLAMPSPRQSIAVDGGAAEVFRLSPDEPWRIIRTRWRIAGVVKGAVEGGGRVSGYFTGATGTTIYRGDAYGPDFVNNSFTGDAGGQLVHRKQIRASDDGVSLVGERPADERGFEFAASKDTWVRVVDFANAPDGCLNIIDMYREVIEHPWSIPDEIKKHLDLNNGNDRGRIYRIAPDARDKSRGTRVSLGNATTEQLVATLAHPNGWHRDAAQRLIYERNDKAAVPMLEKLLEGDNTLAKLHALGALNGLGALNEKHIASAIASGDAFLIERGLKLFGDRLDKKPSSEIIDALSKIDFSKSNRVTYQAMLMLPDLMRYLRRADILGNGSAASVADNLAGQGMLHADNAAIRTAYLASMPDAAPMMLPMIINKQGEVSKPMPVVEQVLELTAAALASKTELEFLDGDYANLQTYLYWVADQKKPGLVRALAAGLKRGGSSLEKVDKDKKLAAVFADAVKRSADSKATEASRLDAIELLGLAPSKESTAALEQCLEKGQPDAVQTAAVKELSSSSSAAITKTLLDAWPNYGTKARATVTEAMFAREDRAVALLEANVIKPTELSASQVQSLVHHKSPKVAAVAKKALAAVIPPSREEVVAKFKDALTTKGDVTRGQNQFISRCMACHRAGTMGLQVGPDLVTVKTKGRDGILTAILEPNKEVAAQFLAYIVNTKDGQSMTGVIAEDNASSLTLKMMGGITKTIERSNIKGSSSSGQSLMPEGLETGMTVQDMADLLDFIESLK